MLVPFDQTQETLRFPRKKHAVKIGRVEGMADVVITDPRISEYFAFICYFECLLMISGRENHCTIIWDGMDTVKLQDQGMNPTFVSPFLYESVLGFL